jgi:hypothetical protein
MPSLTAQGVSAIPPAKGAPFFDGDGFGMSRLATTAPRSSSTVPVLGDALDQRIDDSNDLADHRRRRDHLHAGNRRFESGWGY